MTVTWRKKSGPRGILAANQSVTVEDGMSFSVTWTGNA